MAISRISMLLGAAIFAAGSASAFAADLYGNGGSIKDPYVAPMMSSGPSWYVRVDGGYAAHDDPVMIEDYIYDLSDTSIDGTWSVGGGFGRYFTSSLRGDVTYDHRFEADAEGSNLDTLSTLPGVRSFGIESDVVLFNMYYDFNRTGRFNPYIGVGLGVTRNTTTAGTVSTDCGCVGTIDGGSETSAAGALMAGFTAKLRGGQTYVEGSSKDAPMMIDGGRALYLDVGYRFLYLGDAATGAITMAPTAGGPNVVSEDPVVENIHAHEVRVGLRYDIR